MNTLDIFVLIVSIVAIAMYGVWHTRNRRDLNSYLKGSDHTPWWVIGISVMATQASAITFLSTPGQGYLGGLSFLQVYFGVPVAMVIIALFFLPIFHKLHIFTAYEYLEKRFDRKTRLFGAGLFLLQRGIGAGFTIYAPAIVLSTVFGWSLPLTIVTCGLIATAYTVFGGTDAVTVTQKYQMAVIFLGMTTAAGILLSKLPAGLTFMDAMNVAGGFQKLNAVNFSTSLHERYTFWSGLLGGTFLMLSYFGADQSQVQRYLSGDSLRESRLGLMFNAVCKIPMQLSILMLGVLMFVFYQFERPPLFFDSAANRYLESQRADGSEGKQLLAYEKEFNKSHELGKQHLESWLAAKRRGDENAANAEFVSAAVAQQEGEKIRLKAAEEWTHEATPQESVKPGKAVTANSADYVFITFILRELPHGAIGLLVAAFFAAALSSKAAELNALGTCTTIDFYRLLIKHDATDAECLFASKCFTAFWGVIAVFIALYAHLSENLIQAVNILGSIFYGVLLALFVVGFFLKRVGGTALFWSALISQTLVFVLYFSLSISYLWYPLIGCTACVLFSLILQVFFGRNDKNPVGASLESEVVEAA
ncbi:MAG TPA: sodium:solute symporter [Candidatus Melainabacteria bacterium]|nr:sodium:solute symporter [Candidatus Melainabacteria bacterium]HIN66091.1 sodium:solute symporter [Candidatus Obscuribacterales bacterium]